MKGMFNAFKGECMFIQETKMDIIDTKVIRSVCSWLDYQFAMCPSTGVLGGILLLWNVSL